MKPYHFRIILILLASSALFTSCLKKGLDDLPAFSEALVTDVFFQYRYVDPNNFSPDGAQVVRSISLPVTSKVFKLKEKTGALTDSVVVTLSVPVAGSFNPIAERDRVTASKLVCLTNISTAASIAPLNSAPKLGTPGDYASPQQYKVVAADRRSERIWTIIVKLNK